MPTLAAIQSSLRTYNGPGHGHHQNLARSRTPQARRSCEEIRPYKRCHRCSPGRCLAFASSIRRFGACWRTDCSLVPIYVLLGKATVSNCRLCLHAHDVLCRVWTGAEQRRESDIAASHAITRGPSVGDTVAPVANAVQPNSTGSIRNPPTLTKKQRPFSRSVRAPFNSIYGVQCNYRVEPMMTTSAPASRGVDVTMNGPQ